MLTGSWMNAARIVACSALLHLTLLSSKRKHANHPAIKTLSVNAVSTARYTHAKHMCRQTGTHAHPKYDQNSQWNGVRKHGDLIKVQIRADSWVVFDMW